MQDAAGDNAHLAAWKGYNYNGRTYAATVFREFHGQGHSPFEIIKSWRYAANAIRIVLPEDATYDTSGSVVPTSANGGMVIHDGGVTSAAITGVTPRIDIDNRTFDLALSTAPGSSLPLLYTARNCPFRTTAPIATGPYGEAIYGWLNNDIYPI